MGENSSRNRRYDWGKINPGRKSQNPGIQPIYPLSTATTTATLATTIISTTSGFFGSTATAQTKTVIVSGAITTNVDWSDDLNDKDSDLFIVTAFETKTDLEKIFSKSENIESVSVEIIGFEVGL